jgi:hypothetical protein
VTSVTIAGYPSVLQVRQSVPLTATATLSNGSSQDVTSAAAWAVSDPAVALVGGYDSTTGTSNLLTAGVSDGEANITATYRTVVGIARIVVRGPASLQEISGIVHEAGARANLPLPDVRIEISGGTYSGASVLTDERGRFAFADVYQSGIELSASRRGYENARFQVAVLPRDKVADIGMRPMSPIVQQVFDGTLSPECVSGDATRSQRFTVRGDGLLLVSEQRINAFESLINIYRGSTPLKKLSVDGALAAFDVTGGTDYELRVGGGYCAAPYTGNFHLAFTRPE